MALDQRMNASDERPARDLAEQLGEAKDALKNSEERFRHEQSRAEEYLDTAEVILLSLDIDGRITLVNRYACAVLGWTRDELLGRKWVDLCLPGRIREELKKKFHALTEGDLSIVENPLLTRSGEERFIEWRNRILRDDKGDIIGTLSSGTDITERKLAETEFKRLHDEIQLQRLRVFKATMRTVQDIVNNLLNGLQFVQFETEGQPPTQMQMMLDEMIRDVALKLKTLGNLETVQEKEMASGLEIDYPGAQF